MQCSKLPFDGNQQLGYIEHCMKIQQLCKDLGQFPIQSAQILTACG